MNQHSRWIAVFALLPSACARDVRQGMTAEGSSALEWAQSDREYYDHEPWHGTISFHPHAQSLDLMLNFAQDGSLDREVSLASLRKAWSALAFTQLGAGELFLVGLDNEPREVVGLRLRFDPLDWKVRSVEEVFVSTKLHSPISVDLLPDGERLVLLDRGTASLHLLDLRDGTLVQLLADPKLASMRHVHTHPIGDMGVSIWATQPPETGLNTPRLLGPYIELIDYDGDGEFETLHS